MAKQEASCGVQTLFQIVAQKKSAVDAIAENGYHGASEPQQKFVCAPQRMPPKPLGAGPLDSPPLQPIIRFDTDKLVKGTAGC